MHTCRDIYELLSKWHQNVCIKKKRFEKIWIYKYKYINKWMNKKKPFDVAARID